MSADYTLKFTDAVKGSLVVPIYNVDGPATPHTINSTNHVVNNVKYPITATSPSSTLVFVGRGVADYGETIQQNLLYMLEHFASATPPIKPIQGQLWYNNSSHILNIYNGAGWNSFLSSQGGVLTGPLMLNANPLLPFQAATKDYVDNEVAQVNHNFGDTSVIQSNMVSAGERVFVVPAYNMGSNKIWVYVNGIKQIRGKDYEETTPTSITFAADTPIGATIEILNLP